MRAAGRAVRTPGPVEESHPHVAVRYAVITPDVKVVISRTPSLADGTRHTTSPALGDRDLQLVTSPVQFGARINKALVRLNMI
jgi:hypothetical protein